MKVIENLYSAFKDISKPSNLDACDHCMSIEDQKTLLEQSLEATDPAILWHYIDDAIWTVGDGLDFKYYVPRLLDLGLTTYDYGNFSGNFIAFPVTFGKKLALADFDKWDKAKRDVVDDAILAIMTEEAHRGDFYNFEGWMCAICYVGLDKARYLNFLDSKAGEAARDYFLVSHRNAYDYGRMEGPFWDELDVKKTSVVFNWLLERKEESDVALGRHRRSRR